MMTSEQLLVNSWRNLPADKQMQVLDFVEFLRDRPKSESKPRQPIKKRSFPVPELAGKVQILGDIVSPIVDEEDWECLK